MCASCFEVNTYMSRAFFEEFEERSVVDRLVFILFSPFFARFFFKRVERLSSEIFFLARHFSPFFSFSSSSASSSSS